MDERVIRRGEIYWINRGTQNDNQGSEQWEGRPAVIVSNNKNNQFSSVCQIVFLTTQPKNDLPTHVLIDDKTAKLNEPSTALCEKITKAGKERIGGYIGRVADDTMEKIDKALMIQLDLDRYIEESPKKENLTTTIPEPTIKPAEPKPQSTENTNMELEKYKAEAAFYKKQYETIFNKLLSKI